MAFIQLPFLFSFLEEQRSPELKGRSFIIRENCRTPVLAVSVSAYKRGFRQGDYISILPEDLLCIKDDSVYYEHGIYRIISALGKFSPLIEKERKGLYIDLSGNEYRYGGIDNLIEEIFSSISGIYDTEVFIGFGSNKLISRLASDILIPGLRSCCLYIPLYSDKLFINQFPISLLPAIDENILDILDLLDINEIQHLALLSQSFLFHLFGEKGIIIHKYAQGICDEKLKGEYLRREVFSHIHFDPTNSMKKLRKILYSLIEDICYKLRSINNQSNKALVHIGFEDKKYIKRKIRLNEYTYSEIDLYDQISMILDFEKIRRINIRYISIAMSDLIPAKRQKTLVPKPSDNFQRILDIAFDIRKKHGKDKLSFKFNP